MPPLLFVVVWLGVQLVVRLVVRLVVWLGVRLVTRLVVQLMVAKTKFHKKYLAPPGSVSYNTNLLRAEGSDANEVR